MKLYTASIVAVAVSLASCTKEHHVNPTTLSPKPNKATSSVDQNPSSSNGVLNRLVSEYPYCDTFYGPYEEYSMDLSPNNVSGYSKVFVWHLSKDSIEVMTYSIGLARASFYDATTKSLVPNDGIYLYTSFPGTYPYTFLLGDFWWHDRGDFYSCTLYSDSLTCNIIQDGSICASEYDGRYTGMRTNPHH